MADLTLKGLSDDGQRLVLVDEDGAEFTLDLDARLRDVVRPAEPKDGVQAVGAASGVRRGEKSMESALRPRDIQARIRAGETPESVAAVAGSSVEKIMVFAAPVLAERQHVAERAQRSSVRRRGGDASASGGARTLGDVVAFHLRSLNVDPETVEWDAWRREDGRWSLTGDFAAGARSGSASFMFDAPGNYVTAENDDARWLLGEQVGTDAGEPAPPARDDLASARERRLSVAPTDDELPLGDELGDDAIGLVHEPDESQSLGAEQPLEAFLDDEPPTREVPAVRDEPAAEADEHAEEPAEEPEPRRPAKKKGRASVPSWDEIMFGGGKND